MRRVLLFAAFVVMAVSPLQAATYIVPSDAEMIQRSDDIVVATGVTSLVERDARGAIVTRYTLRVEEALKGRLEPGDHLVLTEVGGQLGDVISIMPGSPEYIPGQRYVVFTETNHRFEPITFGMSLGQFVIREGRERAFAVRGDIFGFDNNLGTHRERVRDARGFIDYIRGIVSMKGELEPHYLVEEMPAELRVQSEWKVESLFSRNSYLMQSGGKGFRWNPPTATFVTSGAAVGAADGIAGVDQAMSQWNGTDSNINYKRGAQQSGAGDILCNTCDNTRTRST